MDRKETLLQAPTQVLVTHAVLLLRTVNRYESKEKQLSDFARYYSKEILADYIVHFLILFRKNPWSSLVSRIH